MSNKIKGVDNDHADFYTDGLPKGYLSVSQVNQYLKCGEAYYQKYVLEQTTPSSFFQVQGRAIHSAAEAMHNSLIKGTLISHEEALQAYSDLHDAEIDDVVDDTAPEELTAGKLKDIGLRLTSEYHVVASGDARAPGGVRIDPPKPVAAEFAFRVQLEQEGKPSVPFLGYIDLVEETAISDLKTKKKAASQGEVDNSLQLSMYAHVTGKPDVRLDQLIRPTKSHNGKFVRTRALRTRQEVLHAVDIVCGVAEDITAGRFRKSTPDAWWCTAKWCPFWHRCRGKNR